MIENITQQMHFKLIMILLFSWSILPSILPKFITYGLNGSTLGAFALLYIIGAYLRLYPNCRINRKKYSWLTVILCVTFTLVYKYFEGYFNGISIKVDCFSNVSIISIGFAVAAFCIFNSMSLKSNKKVNEISLCTFGIYLIHDNNYVRGVLWHRLIKGYEYQNSPYMILHMIACAFIVFIACLTIEFIRKKTIDKLWIGFGEKHVISCYERMRNKYDCEN